jgi:hypothetical protein
MAKTETREEFYQRAQKAAEKLRGDAPGSSAPLLDNAAFLYVLSRRSRRQARRTMVDEFFADLLLHAPISERDAAEGFAAGMAWRERWSERWLGRRAAALFIATGWAWPLPYILFQTGGALPYDGIVGLRTCILLAWTALIGLLFYQKNRSGGASETRRAARGANGRLGFSASWKSRGGWAGYAWLLVLAIPASYAYYWFFSILCEGLWLNTYMGRLWMRHTMPGNNRQFIIAVSYYFRAWAFLAAAAPAWALGVRLASWFLVDWFSDPILRLAKGLDEWRSNQMGAKSGPA